MEIKKTSFPAAVSCHKQVKSTFLQWLIYNHFRFDFYSNSGKFHCYKNLPTLIWGHLTVGASTLLFPCTWFKLWLCHQKVRQITNISDLFLLFDEFLFLTFAASQSDDFLVKLLRLPPNRKPCDFIKACYWIDQKILNSSNYRY